MAEPRDITPLLEAAQAGGSGGADAMERLMSVVHADLTRMAEAHLCRASDRLPAPP